MHKRQPVDLFLAAVPAGDVIARKSIDIMSASNPRGYQRALEQSRVNGIARYVLNGEGMLPTALLVNIRNGAWFEPFDGTDSTFGTDSNFGRLHFADEQAWWIEDGQHRTLGVEAAINTLAHGRRPAQLAYDLPIVFCLSFTRNEEMELFNTVNSKAKSVPTDLVASIIFNRVSDEREKDQPGKVAANQLRKAAGVAVGRYLAQRPPWTTHIQEVNEPKDVINKPMQANTFASTLLPLMRERWIHSRFLTNPADRQFVKLSEIVQGYWEVLGQLMPEAFGDIAHYSVQRPIGVYAFHELLPEVLDACRMENDYSHRSFREKLQRLDEWVVSSTWHRELGADIIKGSGNRAAIRVVVERMRTLFHPELPGLGESGDAEDDLIEVMEPEPLAI
jgi:DGQHR domain-containing protein